MAHSVNGGTRAMLRGRVGSDVYSIGKNAKGKKQQVVRSLAEQVANPQTIAQMRGRMIMSTVMQSVSAMAVIVDHSFDGVAAGQPSISEFIAQNYALVKADVAAHPSSANIFGLNMYQEKGAKAGAYIMSAGAAALPAVLVFDANNNIVITLPADTMTIGDLKSTLGLTSDEYFTLVGFTSTAGFAYKRFRVTPSLTDSTVITSDNIGTIFVGEGTLNATVSLASNVVTIASGLDVCRGIIVSIKSSNGYKHNTCQLSAPTAPEYNATVALATYPVGQQRFLNGGGDVLESVVSTEDGSGDGGSTQAAALSSVRVNSQALTQDGTLQLASTSASGAAATIVAGMSNQLVGAAYKLRVINKTSGATIGSDVTFAEGAATWSGNLAPSSSFAVQLLANDNVLETWGTITTNAYDASTEPGEGD